MTKREKEVARIQSKYMKQYDVYVERQKKKKKRLFRRLVLFSLMALLMLGGMAGYHLKQRAVYAEKQEQYEQLKDEMASLKQEEKNLEQEVQLLQDEEYVKEIARTQYFFSKEGEIIFKLPQEDSSY